MFLAYCLRFQELERVAGTPAVQSAFPRERKKVRLRNTCDCAQRCIGTLSQPSRSLLARNEPSDFCQREKRSVITPESIASSPGNRPYRRTAKLMHSA